MKKGKKNELKGAKLWKKDLRKNRPGSKIWQRSESQESGALSLTKEEIEHDDNKK